MEENKEGQGFKFSHIVAVVFYLVGIGLIFLSIIYTMDVERPRKELINLAKAVVYAILGVGSMIFARLNH